jgi:hypothetical protein
LTPAFAPVFPPTLRTGFEDALAPAFTSGLDVRAEVDAATGLRTGFAAVRERASVLETGLETGRETGLEAGLATERGAGFWATLLPLLAAGAGLRPEA